MAAVQEHKHEQQASMKDVELGGAFHDTSKDSTEPEVTMSEQLANKGVYTMKVSELSYKVKIKDSKTKETIEKTLIQPVSFTVRPRAMLAIMGASGAGKSTMLDILATRIDHSKVTGAYLMNDKPVPSSFKRISGYVMQDDALYPLLTVRETFRYAAMLRIPNTTKAQKYQIVEETITALKLGACADTVIGDDRTRGLSGGEKRRVSIGVDIIHQPSIIFLDEPTSGLDSTTALQIVETLHGICARNRTIAMTIHQPSTRVFEVFDRVMFLSKGYMIYHDTPQNLAAHIEKVSKKPLPQFANLPELFLEVVDGFEKNGDVASLVTHREEADRMRQASFSTKAAEDGAAPSSYANNVVAESLILLNRNGRNVIRTPELFFVRTALCVVMGLVLGSLFWNVGNNQSGVSKRLGYIAFLEAFFIFTSLEALPIFLNERAIFIREHSRGAYRSASYVVANFLIYLPVFAIMSVVFTSISFYMVGLTNNGVNFLYQIIVLFCILMTANAFVTFISALVPDALTGNSAGSALFAFQFLFGGFFIPYTQIPRGWKWFSWLSMFRYPFEGLLKSNLIGFSDVALKQQIEKQYNIETVDRWRAVWVLIIFTLGWRFFFYLVLRTKYSGARS